MVSTNDIGIRIATTICIMTFLAYSSFTSILANKSKILNKPIMKDPPYLTLPTNINWNRTYDDFMLNRLLVSKRHGSKMSTPICTDTERQEYFKSSSCKKGSIETNERMLLVAIIVK